MVEVDVDVEVLVVVVDVVVVDVEVVSTSPVSDSEHVGPPQPSSHLHSNESVPLSTHFPNFEHGFFAQSSMSSSHVDPRQPTWQSHLNELPMSVHEPCSHGFGAQ